MKKKLFLPILCVFITGCVSETNFERKINSYMGAPKHDIILSFGIPNNSYRLNERIEILEYEKGYMPNGGFAVPHWCKLTFAILDGVAADWKSEGNMCKSD